MEQYLPTLQAKQLYEQSVDQPIQHFPMGEGWWGWHRRGISDLVKFSNCLSAIKLYYGKDFKGAYTFVNDSNLSGALEDRNQRSSSTLPISGFSWRVSCVFLEEFNEGSFGDEHVSWTPGVDGILIVSLNFQNYGTRRLLTISELYKPYNSCHGILFALETAHSQDIATSRCELVLVACS